MAKSVKLFRIFGIDIELHYSWFFVFLLLAYGLGTGFFPFNYPGLPRHQYAILGIISSLLLFVSVLLHEMSHSLIAKLNKLPASKITLFFFGGIAQIEDKHLTPMKELTTSVAGPIFSLILGTICIVGFSVLMVIKQQFFNIYLLGTLEYLFKINFILAFFNLVPAYPLDGGRVFRAILWKITGNLREATRYAVIGGRIFAYFLIAVGVLAMFAIGDLGGLWFVFLGLFLLFIAKMSYQQVILKETLSKVKVSEVMRKDFDKIKATETLDKVVTKHFLVKSQSAFPVMRGKDIIGIIDLKMIEKVPRHEWIRTKAADLRLKRRVISIKHDANAYISITNMLRSKIELGVVRKGKKIVGLLDEDGINHYLRIKMELER